MLSRKQVVVAIRALREELTAARASGEIPPSPVRVRDIVLEEIVALACTKAGVTTLDYRLALEVEPSLLRLHEETSKSVLIDSPPDPGPYDVISRESPCGNETNGHIGDTFHPSRGR